MEGEGDWAEGILGDSQVQFYVIRTQREAMWSGTPLMADDLSKHSPSHPVHLAP